MDQAPLIIWFRRDLRLHDHPALQAAVAAGRPIVPLFILDPQAEALGAAPKWRLGEGLASFARVLEGLGSRLILRRGSALEMLRAVIAETGAAGVHWSRLYDPEARARDSALKSALRADGLVARSFPGHLLFEPWEVSTKEGGPYRVYSPFWRAVQGRALPPALPAVERLEPPAHWPRSDRLEDWQLGAAMNRGAHIVGKYAQVGEARALDRLAQFLDDRLDGYARDRDFPATSGTSGLSENLTLGEISPRTIWHAAWRRLHEGASGAETFLKELVWREFAWHLYFHFPTMAQANWRAEWDGFPWRADNDDAEAWRRGMTGEPFVDAAMREMFTTGTMHNRARMIAASYLTKHLLTDWRVGLRWFQDCLIDWDPAANAMGWQWVAGSGPDAAPYFRVFNPAGQAEKFDARGEYRRRFLAEGQRSPPEPALDFFAAVPRSWQMTPTAAYPERRVALDKGRARALAAYQGLRE